MSRKAKIYIIGGILSAIVLAIGCFLIFKMVSTESIVMVLLIIVGGGAFFLLSFYGNGLEGQDRMLVDYQMKRMRDEFSKYNASNGPSNEVIQDILRRISELEKKIFTKKT